MPRTEHILIVDDEEHIRQALAMILIDRGFKVTLAGDGREALEALRLTAEDDGTPVSLILMDIHMPNMSGLALLDALHGSECYPPVVAVTGYGDRHTVEELRKRGCDCCLDKPAAPGDVVQSIHDALNLRRAQHINP